VGGVASSSTEGGVVGGVAAAAAVIAFIVVVLVRRRRQRQLVKVNQRIQGSHFISLKGCEFPFARMSLIYNCFVIPFM